MQRGDIYEINLGRGIGRECGGTHHVVVVSDSFTISLQWMIAIVPALDASKHLRRRYGVRVPATESGLSTDLLLLPNQIRSVDFSRFPKHSLGAVSAKHLSDLAAELRDTLEIK